MLAEIRPDQQICLNERMFHFYVNFHTTIPFQPSQGVINRLNGIVKRT